MIKNQGQYLLLTSLLGHVLIFLLVGLVIRFQQNEPSFGETSSNVISAHLYSINAQNHRASPAKALHKIKGQTNLSLSTQGIAKKHIVRDLSRTKAPSQLAKQGEAMPALIHLLHQAIQRQQMYPDAALEMQREGKATLKFMLYPNGEITTLKVVQSSGVTVLDEAALQAVKAAPFQGIEAYLKTPQEYQITVAFELT